MLEVLGTTRKNMVPEVAEDGNEAPVIVHRDLKFVIRD